MIFISCEKDESIVEPAEEEVAPDYQAISSARDWFYDQTGGDVLLEVQSQTKSTGNSTIQHPLLGDWESGLTSKIENIKNVEVPVYSVDNEEAYSEALNDPGNLKRGATGKKDENQPSRTRFVIQTDEETGASRGFMMTVIPDEGYLASGGSINSIDYYKRGTDFSGLIVFHQLDGNFANAWEYEGGEIRQGYVPGKEKPRESQLKIAAAYEVFVCTICYETWGTSGGVSSYNGTTCYQRYESVLVFGGGYGGGGGSRHVKLHASGGGGSITSGDKGGYIEPVKPLVLPKTPLTDKIKLTNSLDPAQMLLLENALDELIGVCSDEYIYNQLVAKGKKFNFAMDSSLGGLAGYNPASKTFSFKNNDAISSGKLKEEFFHAFQDAFYAGGISQYENTGKVNVEFEAKLYTDLSNVGCCIGFNMVSCPQKIKDDYLDWIIQLRKNPSGLRNTDYQHWLKLFNTYTPSYSSPLATNLSSPGALKSIISNSKCY